MYVYAANMPQILHRPLTGEVDEVSSHHPLNPAGSLSPQQQLHTWLGRVCQEHRGHWDCVASLWVFSSSHAECVWTYSHAVLTIEPFLHTTSMTELTVETEKWRNLPRLTPHQDKYSNIRVAKQGHIVQSCM